MFGTKLPVSFFESHHHSGWLQCSGGKPTPCHNCSQLFASTQFWPFASCVCYVSDCFTIQDFVIKFSFSFLRNFSYPCYFIHSICARLPVPGPPLLCQAAPPATSFFPSPLQTPRCISSTVLPRTSRPSATLPWQVSLKGPGFLLPIFSTLFCAYGMDQRKS